MAKILKFTKALKEKNGVYSESEGGTKAHYTIIILVCNIQFWERALRGKSGIQRRYSKDCCQK